MKRIILLTGLVSAFFIVHSQPAFENAQKEAKEKHKLILLNFSGSDWCIPCIKMHKEIFENDGFKKTADSLLVLVIADFPRNKKNRLADDIKKQNEVLADKYNPEGAFPYTLLLDADGKVLKAWNGLPKANAAGFTDEITAVYANHNSHE